MKIGWAISILSLVFIFEATASTEERCLIEMTSFKGLIKGDLYQILNQNQSPKDQLLRLCRQKITCKSLWVRGHFGGEFFNENYTQKLSLEELETLSCQEECQNFFNSIEEVHLLGCNTLSSNNRDLRTNEEYLNVLRRHGVSSQEAASFSAQRYGLIGKSFKERFQQIFSETQRINGFKGRTTALEIDQYLKKGKKTNNFLTTSGIKKIRTSTEELEISNKELTCEMRLSNNLNSKTFSKIIQELIDNGTFFREFDAIKDFLKRNPAWKPENIKIGPYIENRMNDLISEKHSLSFISQILYVFKRLEWIIDDEFNKIAELIIVRSFKKTLSPESRDAICDPLFKWPVNFLNELSPSQSFFRDPWRVRALGCLRSIPEIWVNALIYRGSSSKDVAIRTESFRALGLIDTNNSEIIVALRRGQNDLSSEVRKEAIYSLNQKLKTF